MRTITSWTEVGAWHKGPAAPNGSVPGRTERRLRSCEVIAADYYGKGEVLYLNVSNRIQEPGEYPGPRHDVFQYAGQSVYEYAKQAGVDLTTVVLAPSSNAA